MAKGSLTLDFGRPQARIAWWRGSSTARPSHWQTFRQANLSVKQMLTEDAADLTSAADLWKREQMPAISRK
jgi:hypothetical protein